MRTYILFVIKLAVTAALLWFLFAAVNFTELVNLVSTIPWWVFIYAIACSIASAYISSARWSMLLGASGIDIPLARLVSYNFSYNFYSLVLPGGKVAAEAVRIYQIITDSHDSEIREKIFFPTILDRSLVVAASAVVTCLFFVFVSVAPGFSVPAWLPYAGIAMVMLVGATVFLPFERLFFSHNTTTRSQPLLQSLFSAFMTLRSRPSLLITAFGLSLFMNAVLASGVYAVSLALSYHVPFLIMFSVFSAGMMMAFLPFTIGGIGAREGAFAYLLSVVVGLPLSVAVSISLINLAASLVAVGVGGAIEFHRHFIRNSQ